MQIINHWHIFATPALVAQAVCDDIMRHAQQAIYERGCFKLVLAGGSTPEQVYPLLVQRDTDWSKWFIYYGDERCLPADHPDRNSVMAQQAFLNHVDIAKDQIMTIPAELGNVEAARQYQRMIAEAMPFDLVLLGMGEDGHTASLFPDQQYPPDEIAHAVFNAPKLPPERVSLSAKALSDTRRLLFLITGERKKAAVQQWQTGFQLPVCKINPTSGVGVDVYIDDAALG
ncbi:MAG: 6-phosphogluconolactonase [Methylococcaceae bacterium]|nr:6-phosphogluconolactonase [Methylococcaceae bacterium]